MRQVRCPTCYGVGQVQKAMPPGTVMAYVGPNGEGWPMEFCRTCSGSGWVWEVPALDGTPIRLVFVPPEDKCERCGGTGRVSPVSLTQFTVTVQTIPELTISAGCLLA